MQTRLIPKAGIANPRADLMSTVGAIMNRVSVAPPGVTRRDEGARTVEPEAELRRDD